jgi:dihydroxy-acid dehydratase
MLELRRKEELLKNEHAFTPGPRERMVSLALKFYASMVTSADTGAGCLKLKYKRVMPITNF